MSANQLNQIAQLASIADASQREREAIQLSAVLNSDANFPAPLSFDGSAEMKLAARTLEELYLIL